MGNHGPLPLPHQGTPLAYQPKLQKGPGGRLMGGCMFELSEQACVILSSISIRTELHPTQREKCRLAWIDHQIDTYSTHDIQTPVRAFHCPLRIQG